MPPAAPRIVSLNVGMPRLLVGKDGQTYESSIGRKPVDAPVRLTGDGFVGDACKYPGHGGENMRVNVFCVEAYALLEEAAGVALARPAFGENFTLEGWTEDQACVGDTFRAGTAVVQVSQPREPCGNVVRNTGLAGIVKVMERTGLTGYYLRVIEPGDIAPGDRLDMIARGEEAWTIRRLNEVMFQHGADAALLDELDAVSPLSANWKRSLRLRCEKKAGH